MKVKVVTNLGCDFCGKSEDDIDAIVAGPNGSGICNACVDLCNHVIAEHKAKSAEDGAARAIRLSVECDASLISAQIAELAALLERLPDGVRDDFRSRVANLPDFGIEAETLSAAGASTYVLRFRSSALAELCAAALRAADGNGA